MYPLFFYKKDFLLACMLDYLSYIQLCDGDDMYAQVEGWRDVCMHSVHFS